MRRFFAAVPFLLLAALLSACGGSDGPAATPTPLFPAEPWTLEYSKSGGIAGLNQRLVLDSNRLLVTEDVGRKRQPRQVYMAPGDVSLLRGRIHAANVPSLKSDQGLPQPDAILISIKVTAQGKSYGATFSTLPDSRELTELLTRLDKLYEEFRP